MNKGETIRMLRRSLGFSQSEVAKRLSISTQTVFKYEHGIITNIPSDKIELLADMFDVTPDYIIGWSNASDLSLDKNRLIAKIRFASDEQIEKCMKIWDMIESKDNETSDK